MKQVLIENKGKIMEGLGYGALTGVFCHALGYMFDSPPSNIHTGDENISDLLDELHDLIATHNPALAHVVPVLASSFERLVQIEQQVQACHNFAASYQILPIVDQIIKVLNSLKTQPFLDSEKIYPVIVQLISEAEEFNKVMSHLVTVSLMELPYQQQQPV